MIIFENTEVEVEFDRRDGQFVDLEVSCGGESLPIDDITYKGRALREIIEEKLNEEIDEIEADERNAAAEARRDEIDGR